MRTAPCCRDRAADHRSTNDRSVKRASAARPLAIENVAEVPQTIDEVALVQRCGDVLELHITARPGHDVEARRGHDCRLSDLIPAAASATTAPRPSRCPSKRTAGP